MKLGEGARRAYNGVLGWREGGKGDSSGRNGVGGWGRNHCCAV